jgi:hypothetical protein
MLNDLPPKAKRRLLLGWLPILLVTILLCVSGGLPPTSWGLTIRLLMLLDALKTVQRSTVSNSLNILLVQSVCTLVAWFMVILAIAYEVREFKAMQAQLRIGRLQTKLASLASNILDAATATPPATAPVAPAVAAPLSAVINGVPSGMDMVTPPMQKNYGVRLTLDTSLDGYPTNPFLSMVDETKSGKSRGVQLFSNQQDQPDPFAAPKKAVDLFDKNGQQDEQSSLQDESVAEPVFVYGNPFEGDLPDVFRYDKALQKAVESLRNVSASKQSSDDSKGINTGKPDQDESNKGSE